MPGGAWIWIMLGVSLVTFVATLVIVPVLLVRMSKDYFVHPKRLPSALHGAHPGVRTAAVIAKNTLGVVLVLGGVAMLVLPGQGILSILVGLSITDFPGKYRVQCALVRRRAVYRAINWIRRKGGREEIVIPDCA